MCLRMHARQRIRARYARSMTEEQDTTAPKKEPKPLLSVAQFWEQAQPKPEHQNCHSERERANLKHAFYLGFGASMLSIRAISQGSGEHAPEVLYEHLASINLELKAYFEEAPKLAEDIAARAASGTTAQTRRASRRSGRYRHG